MQSSALDSAVVPRSGSITSSRSSRAAGWAIVYLAAAQGPGGFNKLLVVKELKPELSRDESYVAMFLDEARLAARLTHPNIVQTIEVGSRGAATSWSWSSSTGARSTASIRALPGRGRLPVGAHLRIIAEALLGLHYAHELARLRRAAARHRAPRREPAQRVRHLRRPGQVLDFGIAKAVDSSLETKTGVLKGRVAYMAPEQAVGRDGRPPRRRLRRRGHDLGGRRGPPPLAGHERRRDPRARSCAKVRRRSRACAPTRRRTSRRSARARWRSNAEDRYATAADLLDDLEAHLARRATTRCRMREVGRAGRARVRRGARAA